MSGNAPARRQRSRHAVMAAALLAAALLAVPSQGAAVSEYDVKAGFLYNFARFTEWPEDAFASETDDLRIEVIGHDPFNGALDRLVKGKSVRSHRVALRYSDGHASQGHSHLAFVSNSERGSLPRVLERLEGSPTLTVSDIDGFAPSGGMIGLVTRDGTVRFVINRSAANRARLQVSSRLLSLATLVQP